MTFFSARRPPRLLRARLSASAGRLLSHPAAPPSPAARSRVASLPQARRRDARSAVRTLSARSHDALPRAPTRRLVAAAARQFFDVPVFWPILLMYWLLLLFVTMKRQIKHMIKHRYLPFSHGKTKYKPGGEKAAAAGAAPGAAAAGAAKNSK